MLASKRHRVSTSGHVHMNLLTHLGHADDWVAHCCNLGGNGNRPINGLFLWHNLRHQAAILGLCSRNAVASQHHLHGAALANSVSQALCASCSSDDDVIAVLLLFGVTVYEILL